MSNKKLISGFLKICHLTAKPKVAKKKSKIKITI